MSTKSFFGSIRRKISTSKQPSDMSSPKDPFSSETASSPRGRSPLMNPSEPMRRPVQDPPPPSYNEAVRAPTSSGNRDTSPAPSTFSVGRQIITTATPEDPYAFLSSFDTIFLIDDSGSMAGGSWREVGKVLQNIAPICTAHDPDGIDVYFLNYKNRSNSPSEGKPGNGYCNLQDEQAIEDLFKTVRPSAATPTGDALNKILKAYVGHYEDQVRRCRDPDGTGVRPINIIVITDGVPTDDPEAVLRRWAGKLDKLDAPPHQVGIQFFQVGREHGAADFLRGLDDGLDGVRDIVDTVSWNASDGERPALTADAILKVVLGAVNKRLDRARVSGEQQRRSNFLSA